MTFKLHPKLQKDCITLGNLLMCRVLLMNNRHFPWLILVPRVKVVRELFDLVGKEYKQVMDEVRLVSECFADFTGADKMNVAALGNQVPQLHIHIIARFKEDAAWPNPVWNSGVPAKPYAPLARKAMVKEIKQILDL